MGDIYFHNNITADIVATIRCCKILNNFKKTPSIMFLHSLKETMMTIKCNSTSNNGNKIVIMKLKVFFFDWFLRMRIRSVDNGLKIVFHRSSFIVICANGFTNFLYSWKSLSLSLSLYSLLSFNPTFVSKDGKWSNIKYISLSYKFTSHKTKEEQIKHWDNRKHQVGLKNSLLWVIRI